jgi:hypothetical protein
MQAFHVTSETSATALLTEGAQAAKINSNGGVQGGRGFYVAPDAESAAYWLHKLGGVTLTVTLPDTARWYDARETSLDADKIAWAGAAGWVADGSLADRFWQEVMGIAGDIDAALAADSLLEQGAIWTLLGLWVQAHGYDGYVSSRDTLVVLNFDLLGAEAFSR